MNPFLNPGGWAERKGKTLQAQPATLVWQGSGAGLDQLQHLQAKAAGPPLAVEGLKNGPGRGVDIPFTGRHPRLLIE